MSEWLIDFEAAKATAIKRISEMTEADEAILYMSDGEGYTGIRIGMSNATQGSIIAHEGMRLIQEWDGDGE